MNEAQFVQARLIRLHEDVAQPEYLLTADRYTIGRLTGVCEILVHRRTVSRIHARLERNGSHFVLHDLSRNQTYVNHAPVNGAHTLHERDLIGLASPEPLLRFVDSDPTLLTGGKLRLDESSMHFTWNQQPLDLTPSQWRLLNYLYQHRGEVCRREQCAQAIWGTEFLPGMDADNLDKVLSGLRARLREVDPLADPIAVRRGLGYTLTVMPELHSHPPHTDRLRAG
jgi:DNA-binding response OmpR family regulator